MAANSTISVTFKITDADGSWKKLSGDADGFKKIVESTLAPVDNLQKKIINWTAASQALSNMQQALGNLQNFMGGLVGAYETQIMNETRLATVMKQRMNATDDEIQSIKDLASAQQEVGVIGDEVQLAGLQQIATFVNQKSSLEKLAPAMNNLIAQQKGLNATTQDAQAIGNLFGKAMQGNIGALSKVGITFSEAEGKVIKYGTEEEKAAMLAQVITANVGEMNAELAQTDAGQQKQMANAFGDMQEQIGQMLEPIAGVVGSLTQMGQSVFGITQLVTSFGAVANAIRGVVNVQALLNAVQLASPIGWLCAGIAALVAAFVLAYKHSESFRQICDKVWTATKNLASYVWDKLCPAFEWLGSKLKIVWNFIKGIFGIKGDPFKDIKASAESTGGLLEELTNKYKDFTDKTNNTKTPKVEIIPEGSIADYEKKMQDAQKAINYATTTEAREAAQKMYDEYKKKLDELKSDTITIQEGSIAYYQKRMQEAQNEVNNAVTQSARIAAQKMADEYEAQIKRIKMMLSDLSKGGGVSILGSMSEQQMKKLEKFKLPKSLINAGEDTADSWQNAMTAIQQAGSAMQNMGSPVLNVMGTIAQAIASIALGYAQATTSAAKMGPWAWLAFGATGLAQMISMISSIKSATAFADGGVLYGPTLALMGEYQGAKNNPEVIAPLNKLQSIIGGSGGGQVEFKLRGRELVGLISNENARTGKVR